MANDNSLEYYTSLLADENIEVKFSPTATTASFSTASRSIVMPMYDFLNDDARQALISHEVGHALFTRYSKDEFIELANKYGIIFNIVEDVYVERMMKQKYAGLNQVFKKGYKNLFEQNIFKIDAPVNSYSFPDRINLLFKIGMFLPEINFNDEERKIVARLYNIDSNEDVKQIVEEIYKYINKNKNNPVIPEEVETEVDKKLPEESTSTIEEDNSDEYTNDTTVETHDEEDSLEEFDYSNEISPVIGDTYEEMNKHLQELSHESEDPNEEFYNAMPAFKRMKQNFPGKYIVNIDTEKCSNYSDHISCITEFANKVNPKRMNPYIEYVKKCASSGNSYFQMLKSARKMKNRNHRLTGTIDSRMLAKYKTTENIFKKKALSIKETNHGVVILIDYSGSIHDYIDNVILQTAIMTEFCKMNDIAFEVFLFGARPTCIHPYKSNDSGIDRIIKIADSVHYSIKNILYTLPKFSKKYYGLFYTPTSDALITAIESVKKMIACGFSKTHIIVNTDGYCNTINGNKNITVKYYDENESNIEKFNKQYNLNDANCYDNNLHSLGRYELNWNSRSITNIINGKSYKIKQNCEKNTFRQHSSYYIEEVIPTALYSYLNEVLHTEITINYVVGNVGDISNMKNDQYLFYGTNHKVCITKNEVEQFLSFGISFLKSKFDSPITNVSVLDGRINIFDKNIKYDDTLKFNSMMKKFIKGLAEKIA